MDKFKIGDIIQFTNRLSPDFFGNNLKPIYGIIIKIDNRKACNITADVYLNNKTWDKGNLFFNDEVKCGKKWFEFSKQLEDILNE